VICRDIRLTDHRVTTTYRKKFSRIDSRFGWKSVGVGIRHPDNACPTARKNTSKMPKLSGGAVPRSTPLRASCLTTPWDTNAHWHRNGGKKARLVPVIHYLLPQIICAGQKGNVAGTRHFEMPKPNSGEVSSPFTSALKRLTRPHKSQGIRVRNTKFPGKMGKVEEGW